MYSSEDEQNVVDSGSSGSFYQNNKILVWICIAVVLIAIVIFFVKNKSDGSSGGSSSNSENTVSIYPENDVEISLGNSYKLIAVVNNNPNAVVTWSSSDENIAKVDNGQVTGVNYGKATITATYIHTDNRKFENTKSVTISEGKPGVQLMDVSIKDGDLFMPVGGTYNLVVNMNPSNGYVSNKMFTSSNTSVVTINNNGLIEAKGEGEATISINVNNGAFNKVLKVYVSNDYTNSEIVLSPTTITLSKESTQIKVGGTAKISYTITPQEASNSVLKWTSSDESIITVDKNGMITAVKEGKAKITATSLNGISDSFEIEVIPDAVAITDIQLSTTDLYVEVGQTQTITPTIIPDTATDKTLTYTASDTSIISVLPSSDGSSCTITPIQEGMVTLTISDSSNTISKTLNIIITSPVVDSGSGGGGSSCKKTCPNGQYVSNCKCVTCEANNYCVGGKKTACPSGYTSSAGASGCNRTSCPSGSYLDSSYSTGCRPCPSGKVCTGGKAMPKSCANGEIPNSSKTACTKCSGIANCTKYGGGGTSCTCTACQANYSNEGNKCKYIGSKSCASRSTVGECNATSSCKWDYSKGGCINK